MDLKEKTPVATSGDSKPRGTASGSRTKPAKGSNASSTYEQLRRDILTMVLEPGEVLDEVSLSRRFGMSRGPVREAIIRLSGEGLVTTLPNRSTVVSSLDLQSVPSFLDALELMQRAVTRLAAANRSSKELERIRAFEAEFAAASAAQNLQGMVAANYEFHMAISKAGGNKYFTMLYGRLLDEGKRLLSMNFSNETLMRDTGEPRIIQEHADITHAIAAKDVEQAERLGYLHAADFRRRIVKQLNESSTEAISLE